MVIKLYISGISGNKEVKKKQQRVQMILDSKQITYEAIDITEPGKEKDKEFMQQNGKVRESLGKYPLPPQIFNDEDFCGDYEDFDLANEVDELEKFLHIATNSNIVDNESKVNGVQENVIDSTTPEANGKPEEGKNSEVNDVEEVTSTNENDTASNLKNVTEENSAPVQEEVADTSLENGDKESSRDGVDGTNEDEPEEKAENGVENGVEREETTQETKEADLPESEEKGDTELENGDGESPQTPVEDTGHSKAPQSEEGRETDIENTDKELLRESTPEPNDNESSEPEVKKEEEEEEEEEEQKEEEVEEENVESEKEESSEAASEDE